MFLANFCRTCSGISFCVNTWAWYQIFPCLAQTMSLYFVNVIILRPRLCSLCCCLPNCRLSLLSWRSLTWLLSSDFPHLTISSLDDSGFERQSLHTEFTLMHHMIIPWCTIGYPIQLNCAPVEFLYSQCITFFVRSSFQTAKLFDNKEVKSVGSFLDLRSDYIANCIITVTFDFRVFKHISFQCTFHNRAYSVTSFLTFMWCITVETNLCKFELWAWVHEFNYTMSRFELTTAAIWYTGPVAYIDF